MGGYGSGRYHRSYVKKNLVEHYTRVDVNEFRKRGQWKYSSGMITWRRGEAVTARVGYALCAIGICLEWYTPDGQATRQMIPLATVQQRIGIRYYFKCPRCGERVVHLYAGPPFQCRRCYDLTYSSCQDSRTTHIGGLLTAKRYRNFFKAVQYERELSGRKRVGKRMRRRLLRYRQKSGVIF